MTETYSHVILHDESVRNICNKKINILWQFVQVSLMSKYYCLLNTSMETIEVH